MRRGNKPSIIKNDNGQVLGVCLSSDFTSEHEWGINGINQAFGKPGADSQKFSVPKQIPIFGLERRKITQVPKDFYWFESNKHAGIVYWNAWDKVRRDPAETRELGFGNGALAAAWDEKSFAVISTDVLQLTDLLEIFESMYALNGAIFLGGRETVFDNPGLCLAIASRLPKEMTDGWYAVDKEAYEVQQEMAATGIEELLRTAGKEYFALSPRRKDGKLIFWLNPQEQNKNNSGWFTLEDLKDWAAGKGKIPMSGK